MLLECTARLKCACSPATRTCGTCSRRTSGKPPGYPNRPAQPKRVQPEYRGAVSQACYWEFYKSWSTCPPTRPDLTGRNCPLSAMGVKVSFVCSNSTVFLRIDIFSQYGEINNSIKPRDAYMHHWPGSPLTQVMAWVSARRQAIAWTNFHFIISNNPTNTLQWFLLVVWKKNAFGNDTQIAIILSRPQCVNMALIYIATTTFMYPPNGYTCNRVKHQKKLHFLTQVIITTMKTHCIHGNNVCSQPIYYCLGCFKRHFRMKIWYPTKWRQNVAIIY